MKRELLIIKFGTASITKADGTPDQDILAEIARQISILHKNYRVVIVSSGAVGAGKQFIKKYEGNINQRKAAAAIGNPLLLKMYDAEFSKYGIVVAQSLLERQHFAKREQFLQLKATYEELWKNNIIPIANENDVVSNRELKFSDNDELATLIAGGFGATHLLLCTVSGGLLDGSGKIVDLVEKIDTETMGLVNKSKSSLGLGGMASKLTFTHLATKMGIKVSIFGMKQADGIINALQQKSGTSFLPEKNRISARNKWMASGGMTVGKITIDKGAVAAIHSKKSLLSVGILEFEGDFQTGEIVEIIDIEQNTIAVGTARLSAEKLKSELKTPNTILVHVDDLVIL